MYIFETSDIVFLKILNNLMHIVISVTVFFRDLTVLQTSCAIYMRTQFKTASKGGNSTGTCISASRVFATILSPATVNGGQLLVS